MKRYRSWKFPFMFAAPLCAACSCQVTAQNTAVLPAQQVLNLLAGAPTPNSPSFGLPSSFAAWPAKQRNTVPKQIEGRCGVLWTMINGGGPVQLLPPAESAQDNGRLALDACVLAKMPADWPPHQAMFDDLEKILVRSKELGGTLLLPPSLTR